MAKRRKPKLPSLLDGYAQQVADGLVVRLITEGAAQVSYSVSGGKDSQAMLTMLDFKIRQHTAVVPTIVHADLGRAEWPQTPGFVQQLADQHQRELFVVRRVKGDLVQRIEERLNTVSTLDPTRPAKPFWPSAAQRYCTSDLKRDPIAKHHRALVSEGILVSCIGMRAEESPNRRKMVPLSVNKRVSSLRYRTLEPAEAVYGFDGGRLVLDWLPIHHLKLGQVWEMLGSSETDINRRRQLYKAGDKEKALDGWLGHPAYVFGNERLSCALCILASVNDLRNGKEHHPELYQIYVGLEKKSGYTFRDGLSLQDI